MYQPSSAASAGPDTRPSGSRGQRPRWRCPRRPRRYSESNAKDGGNFAKEPLPAMAAMDCGLGLKMISILLGDNKSDGMIIGMRDDCLIGFKIIYMTPSSINDYDGHGIKGINQQ